MDSFAPQVEAMYGTDDQIALLAARLEQLHPDAKMMGPSGCMYMAQMSLATGAQALPKELGEIHVWEEGPDLVFMLGWKYHNRIAAERGGYLLMPAPQPLSTTTRAFYQLHEGDLALECGVAPHKMIYELREMGFSIAQILDNRIGISTGVGVVTKRERHESGEVKATGQTWAHTVERRCIKAGLVKAFGGFAQPLNFEPNLDDRQHSRLRLKEDDDPSLDATQRANAVLFPEAV